MGIFKKLGDNNSVGYSAAILSGSFFASAVLGLLRDRLLAANFGLTSGTLDAYWAAFSIPDMLYYFLVTGALSVSFIPVFVDRMHSNNKKSAWELSSSVVNLMALVTLASSVLIFIFAGPLMSIIAPGFDGERHELAVALMRIIAVNPFVFSISTVLGAIQQASSRFFFFAVSPIVYNLGIIIGIVGLAPSLGIVGVALGVALGSVLQLIMHLIGMIGLGFDYQPRIYWKNKGFRNVFSLLIPRSLDQGIDAVNSMVERFIASFLGFGAIATYQYALNLQNQPIILIGVAISTAAFPSITRRAAGNRVDLFKQEVKDVLGVILWFALPAAAIAFLLRGYLVRLYIGQGNEMVSDALAWFTLAIVFRALFHTLTRAYYAQQDTKTPLLISIVAIGLNIVLAFMFVDMFKNSISGLAAAQSVVAVVEVSLLVYILHRRLKGIVTWKLIYAGFRVLLATAAMSIATYVMVRYVFPLQALDVGFFTLAPKFLAILAVSGLVYIVAGYTLKLRESVMVIDNLKKWLFRPISPKYFQ